MNWIDINHESQIEEIIASSLLKSVVIFKHSTRCNISEMAKKRLERSASDLDINFYYLDLLKHRNISNKIAEDFKVYHQSPQLILLKNGCCVYVESHNGITIEGLMNAIDLH